MDVLKVSSKSVPSSVAGAMAGVVRQHGAVEVQVVGAGALNQAIKAVAIARGYLAPSGIDVVCVPTFVDVQIDGQSRTALRLSIEDRAVPHVPPGRTVLDLREAGLVSPDGDATRLSPDGDGSQLSPDGDGSQLSQDGDRSRAPLSLEA
jgi:stage V sporulation protein S